MEVAEAHRYMKKCNDNNITVYPMPSNSRKYKLVINTNGRENIGSEIYEDKPYIKEVAIKTPQGIKKVKQVVPSWGDKIHELYKQICEKNKF